jgi:hypothetical protein
MKLTLTVMLKMIQNDCSGSFMARRRVLITFEALRCCVMVKFMRYFPADQVGQCRSVQALFLSSPSNLNILNRGNEPTFVVRNRKEVIDLALGTNKMGHLISNWHVSDEPSLSVHRYVCFQENKMGVIQGRLKRES